MWSNAQAPFHQGTEGEAMSKYRYEIQETVDSLYGRNYRITDTATDSRIATCFLRENADLVVAALNRTALHPTEEQKE